MRLDKKLRKLADVMREGHGGVSFTQYVEGLILLDAALVEVKNTRLVTEDELPRWVLYDFPIRAFRAAIAAQREARTRDFIENSQEVDEALDAVQAKPRKVRS